MKFGHFLDIRADRHTDTLITTLRTSSGPSKNSV